MTGPFESTTQSPLPAVRTESSTALEQVVLRFEEAWQSGRRPNIDDFLPADLTLRRQALLELVHTDLEYRLKKAGENARAEEYLERYPDLAGDRTAAVALIAAEFKHRSGKSDGATLEEYLRRFPSYAEELRTNLGGHAPASVSAHPDFEILKELGRGGMGVVYLALQKSLKRRVALKMILPGASWNASVRARFRREAESVARLSHPNIVPVFEVGEHQGCPYFVMEYLERGSIEKQHAENLPAPVHSASLVETLARALAVVHEAGIVHRDLKPANVLLARDGTPKITDFGLAKWLEEDPGLTPADAILGTPNYMAPEQARTDRQPRDRLGPATDVYALGGILYRLLTGRPPHQGPTAIETLLKVVDEDVVPVRTLKPRVPRDLETICLKCLEREPGKRYANALALAEDLARFGRGEPVQARPISRLGRGLKWARRRPAAAVLLGSGVVFTLAAIALAFMLPALFGPRQPTVEESRAEAFRAAGEQLQFADVQAQLGNSNEARTAYEEALDRLEMLLADDPNSIAYGKARLHGLVQFALLLRQQGELPLAKKTIQQALTQLDDLSALEPAAAEFTKERVRLLSNLGIVQAEAGDVAAEQSLKDALDISRTAFSDPNALEAGDRATLAKAHIDLAIILEKAARPLEAERHWSAALPLLRANVEQAPNTPIYRKELALCLMNIGAAKSLRNDPAALQSFQYARATLAKLVEDYPINVAFQEQLAIACFNVGSELSKRLFARAVRAKNAYSEVEINFDEALRLAEALPATAELDELRGRIQLKRGEVYGVTGRPGPTEEALTKARTIFRKLSEQGRNQAAVQSYLAQADYYLAVLYTQTSRSGKALEAIEKALAIQRKLVEEFPASPKHRQDLIRSLSNQSWLFQQARKTTEANKDLFDAAEQGGTLIKLQPTPENCQLYSTVLYQLAGVESAQNRLPAARTHLEAAIQQQLLACGDGKPNSAQKATLYGQYSALAQLLLKSNDYEGAFRALESAQAHGTESSAQELYKAACLVARCISAAENDQSASARQKEETAKRYTDRAVALLNRALERGFTDQNLLKSNPELAPLRDRPDFAKLLERLKKSKE